MRTHPLLLLIIGAFRLIIGVFRFDKHAVGRHLRAEDERTFRVFRRIAPRRQHLPRAGAAFIVRFRPRGMTVQQNIAFSYLPMVVMLGFPGFRSKYWCVDDRTGDCLGVYEWETLEDAERYASSIAMRFMSGRSEAGSVSHRIIPQTEVSYEPTWLATPGSAALPC